jgi:hypothetical protein
MHSLMQSGDAAALGGDAKRNAAPAVVQHQVRRVTCGKAREQLCRTKSSRHAKRIRVVRNEKGRLIMVYDNIFFQVL